MEITDAFAGPAGALYVSNLSAWTTLRGVVISDARAFGIVQHGGTLTMEACIIDRTQALAAPVGVALHLSGGVQAHLQHVWLPDNDGGGLIARDPGTNVRAERLRIERTSINSFATDRRPGSRERQLEDLGGRLPFDPPAEFDVPPGRAALDVRDGARFVGSVVSVVDSEYAGIYEGDDAVAEFEFAYVARTREVIPLAPEGAGIGVWSHENGRIRMQFFAVEESDLCGVLIGPNGSIDLAHGLVARNAIGACVQVAGYDVGRLTLDVHYVDNTTTLESASLSVPEPVDSLDLP